MPARQDRPVFSVTLADCEVQTFAAGGPGGQNQNKRHPLFRAWVGRQSEEYKNMEARIKADVEKAMDEANLKIEVFEGKRWQPYEG